MRLLYVPLRSWPAAAALIAACFALGARPHAEAAPEALYPGWNTIVYQGPALPPAEAFAPLGDGLAAVYEIGAGGVWRYYIPALAEDANTLAAVEAGHVYWLHLTEAATYTPRPPAPLAAPAPAPTPAGNWRLVEEGNATWYGYELAGNRTACGDIFDPMLLTAASNTLPCGTIARVTNKNTGISVVVRINDTGGFRPPLMIDLAQAAFRTISPGGGGVVPVTIEVEF